MSFFAQSGDRKRRGGAQARALCHRARSGSSGFSAAFTAAPWVRCPSRRASTPSRKASSRRCRASLTCPIPTITGRCSPAPIKDRRCCATSRTSCSCATCPRARWPESWSSRSRARAAISCRRTDFWRDCAQLCDRHGILLIFDEVQSGIGRTGKMFAAEHWGVEPDIMTLAKGLGSGMPIGMVVAKRSIMQKWTRGAHGNTFGGNPVCCAAALATLDLVEREYCANAAKVGSYFMKRLHALAQKYPVIGEVRGKGLMLGMELVVDPLEQGAREEALRRPDQPRLPQRADVVVVRPEHGALHAATHDRRGGRRRGDRVVEPVAR